VIVSITLNPAPAGFNVIIGIGVIKKFTGWYCKEGLFYFIFELVSTQHTTGSANRS